MGGRIISVKILATLAVVLSVTAALGLATPAVAEFFTSETSRLYGSVAAYLTPPYLYFILNGIIISIAATARFQKTVEEPAITVLRPPISVEEDIPAPHERISKVEEEDDLWPEFILSAAGENDTAVVDLSVDSTKPLPEDEFIISRSNWSPKRKDSSEAVLQKAAVKCDLPDKPLVSARLGRRRSIKFSPEGKALRVARPRKHETLESTWRTITDGRAVPLARHLKKSDTWEHHARTTGGGNPSPAMRKSETFAARSSGIASSPYPPSGKSSSSVGKVRREPSLGQDDLNRRVEAFIKKFNDEMRLQRQESQQQYMNMINRGSH